MRVGGRPDTEAIGLVLAGGRASRFGADKLAVDLAGRPVLHHAIVAVAAVTGRVLVSLAHDAPPPAMPDLGRPIEVVRDRSGDLGPLAGLAAALDAIGSTADQRLLVVPGDAPFLRPPLLRGLLGAMDHADAAVLADGDDWRPLPCALRTLAVGATVRDRLAGPDRSVRGALRVLRPAIVEESAWRAWDPQGVWRDDIDEPADIARAAARTHREAT
ncbi:MAG TPA: NTP transferase domain-containing protein [Candidatus Sulfotelmatobacter sp.]|nr:NTP transferase domain-containing protein [Candidatus Sulfotelmatobacter sp.]